VPATTTFAIHPLRPTISSGRSASHFFNWLHGTRTLVISTTHPPSPPTRRRSPGRAQQVDAAGGEVLADGPAGHPHALLVQPGVQLLE
jgi:hypothetical protein